MVRPIFLPVAYETAILVYFECVFVCSLCLHGICLFLMVTRTPPAQIVVRNYLILIQLMVLLADAHTDLCMRPIPLFPALAGYGNGMAVRMGLPINLAMAIMAILWTYIGVAIVRCIVHRHPTIVDDDSAFKFRKGSLIVTELLLAFLVPVPMLIWYANGNDRETNERNLIADPHNITWIRERGFYYVDVPGTSKIAMMIAIILTIFLSSLLMVLAFVHMFYTLWKDSAKRSAMSIRLIKRSITNLFLQLIIPICLFAVPLLMISSTVIFGFSGLSEELFSFETLLLAACFVPFHSVCHSVILISITSAYRQFIMRPFHWLCGKISSSNRVMATDLSSGVNSVSRSLTMFTSAIPAPIFLSLESQARIFLYLQIMFAASCCFNALALFFVVTQTPSSHAMVRKYLIAIQIILIISDVHLEILFQPIPIFPALGGFAVGSLIRAGFSLPTELAITIVIYIYTGFVSILCLIYRHQTVVLPGNPLKFRKRSIHFVHFVMLAPPPFLGILIAFIENDQANVELIKKEVTLCKRVLNICNCLFFLGSAKRLLDQRYVILRTPLVHYLMIAVICILIVGTLLLIAVFNHMLYVLQKDRVIRSQMSIMAIRRSLLNLSAQLFLPMNLFVVPATLIFLGLLFDALFSFETMLAIFLVLPTHSIGRNLILLIITPVYRKLIVSCLLKPVLKCKNTISKRPSPVSAKF